MRLACLCYTIHEPLCIPIPTCFSATTVVDVEAGVIGTMALIMMDWEHYLCYAEIPYTATVG